jgi:NAD-dependent SIR2 family protein deacetylase
MTGGLHFSFARIWRKMRNAQPIELATRRCSVMSRMDRPRKLNCGCPLCRNIKNFATPEHLLEKIENKEVVIFAGAGISTENKLHCQHTFYEQIQSELATSQSQTFSRLMTEYCALPDGRLRLLQRIKERFEYFASFDDFYRPMTRFHKAVSPLFMIEDIITTNWDDFFERECSIDTFVYDSDIAFWGASSRRLLKIHGSISNLGSIVATEDDYQRSFKRLNDGPLGAQLKSLIATKTIIYVGYSLSDTNYLRLLRNISRMMSGNIRQSYFVAPTIDRSRLSSAPIPLVAIEADGADFFDQIREHFTKAGDILCEEAFDQCHSLLDRAATRHIATADAFLKTRHPLLILALGYQDGLIHALQRIVRLRKKGDYHSTKRIQSRVGGYEVRQRELISKGDYWNAAYAMGYQAGLLFLLIKNEDTEGPNPPLVDLPIELGARSIAAILRFPKSRIPKVVAKQLARIEKQSRPDLIPDHTPYL